MLRWREGRLRGQQLWYSPVQYYCRRAGQLHDDDLLSQRRRDTLRLSEREWRCRNVRKLSVHWLISNRRVDTEDGHFEHRIQFNCAPSYLGNISTRSFVQTGDNVMIGGFVVQGTTSFKRVIIRAIGPELAQHGVPNPMADPTLELHNANGALIASNDNWQTTIIGGIITSDQRQQIQNSGLAPGDPLESAIIADLPPGNYTAIVRGVNNTTGIALVEAYDLNPETDCSPATFPILGNISTRSFVQTGDNVMIGGFIVQGARSKRLIVRAIGPELSQYGVPNPLPD